MTWSKEGNLEKVKHSFTGDEGKPKELWHINMTNWSFWNPTSDEGAYFKDEDSTERTIMSKFADGKGPRQHVLDIRGAHLKKLAEQAAAQIKAKQQEVASVTAGSSSLGLQE